MKFFLLELEELTEMDSQEDDFAPFTSKVHALTFMLLHSPRPIVSHMVCGRYVLLIVCLQGERNLKFMMFILKQYDPTIASLDVLKRFSLPGFVNPFEVIINCFFQYLKKFTLEILLGFSERD